MSPSACRRLLSPVVVLGLAACAPALDWRDVRPPESGAVLQFPCKPTAQSRQVALAGPPVKLVLHACSAGGQTWALAFADVSDPSRVGTALAELAGSAAANIGAAATPLLPLTVPGATPNPGSGRVRLSGHLPDATAVQMQLAVFAHGTRVFQATVVGGRLSDESVDMYFSSIRLNP